VRRWTLLLAGAALWLFLAAIPALADGGPHVAATNSGVSSLTADGCAGCHRAHTATGPYLLNAAGDEALCLTCHGAAGPGATTDVMTGVQYAPVSATDGTRTGTQLGALRGGGFDQARISSGNPARVIVSNQLSSSDDQWAKVSVRATPQDVTSAHLNLADNGLSAPGVAWGNGAIGLGDTGPGPAVNLTCGSCHNPHGNGQYRILNPIPKPDVSSGTFTPVAAPGAAVRDSSIDPDGNPGNGIANPTKNYTVIQVKGTVAGASSYLLYASDVLDARGPRTKTWPAGDYSATSGDYWHVRVPWNLASVPLASGNDAPNGVPANAVGGLVAFDTQMTSWCSACHTRYYSTTAQDFSGDSLFSYRHQTLSNQACTTCHVSHGSNARMEGTFSATMPFPDGTQVTYSIGGTTGDSRLLTIDNRGTCQMCHDPTYTEGNGQYRGPAPTPGVP
jgi:predicted CXXCH cytochrome family protein